jgi:hypothetical protein
LKEFTHFVPNTTQSQLQTAKPASKLYTGPCETFQVFKVAFLGMSAKTGAVFEHFLGRQTYIT